jgi:hypothetical protein
LGQVQGGRVDEEKQAAAATEDQKLQTRCLVPYDGVYSGAVKEEGLLPLLHRYDRLHGWAGGWKTECIHPCFQSVMIIIKERVSGRGRDGFAECEKECQA